MLATHLALYFFVGFLVVTGTLLYSYFWLLYICHLTLKVFFPLKSAKLFNSDYSRIVYITEILIGTFIATTPSIVNTVLSNYEIIVFPPIQCGNSNRTYFFYTLLVPVITMVSACGILMSLTLYKIHLVSYVCSITI